MWNLRWGILILKKRILCLHQKGRIAVTSVIFTFITSPIFCEQITIICRPPKNTKPQQMRKLYLYILPAYTFISNAIHMHFLPSHQPTALKKAYVYSSNFKNRL